MTETPPRPGTDAILPQRVFLTKGVGVHREKLASFEGALRDAGIAAFNLVRVSSIFPPGCRILPRAKGLKTLSPGQVTFVVMSDNATCEPHRLLSSSVGIAIPKDPTKYGYLSEYHSFGERETKAGDYAEDLAAQMLATTLGVQFNADTSYDERKEIWKISGEIVRTHNVTQSAIGNKRGLWTTVVAAAVFA
jgi:arginine decarboxylase